MDADALLFSYQDADIYQRDLLLFQPGTWLNDSCINFCLKRRIKKDSRIVCLDPSVVSFLLLQADEEDAEELVISLGINSAIWLVVPVNDNDSFTASSNHWSLLLYHIHSGHSFHFDSLNDYNKKASIKVATKMETVLSGGTFTVNHKVVQVSGCPQQDNGYDCGVFSLLFAECICTYLSSSQNEQQQEVIANVVNSGGTVLSDLLCESLASLEGTRGEHKKHPCAIYRQTLIQDIEVLSAQYLQGKS